MAMFCSFGFLNAIGLFQAYYEKHILNDYSPSIISWIFTVQLFLMFFLGGLYGRIIDHYGPTGIMIPSAILSVLSIALTSLCTKYYQVFLAQGLGFGIGAAGIFTPAFVCAGQWFHHRRALALGIAAAGSSLGGVIHPIYVSHMTENKGFPGALRYTALFLGLCLIPVCVFVRARLPPKKWDSNDMTFINFSLFLQKGFFFYSLGSFFVLWGLFAPFNYLPGMALRHGFSEYLSIYTIVVMNAGSVPGRIFPAHLADKVGRFNVMTVISFLSAISILAFWLPLELISSTHTQIFAFAATYGFWSGAYISMLLPCVAELGSVTTLGVRFGTYEAFIAIACLTGLPIQGQLIVHDHGGFRDVCIFSGISMLAGAVLIGCARLSRSGPVLRIKT
ncbi:MFS general substrate transporter [Mytilinidion resinicola]|uniref:MFS general substrate transporter n=1 Tax=Mytilinidion resinicola TaxID=574789 RepID=A0A6A6YQY1_9PEZI|nr:MFS general substrate transporter [Mytilinidion resinicola]KAF2811312.1 MFS general substrate transporter [Mytilinidion resinicola]